MTDILEEGTRFLTRRIMEEVDRVTQNQLANPNIGWRIPVRNNQVIKCVIEVVAIAPGIIEKRWSNGDVDTIDKGSWNPWWTLKRTENSAKKLWDKNIDRIEAVVQVQIDHPIDYIQLNVTV